MILTESELEHDLSIARAARIVELELMVKAALAAHEKAGRVLREVLAGAGASTDEQLRATVVFNMIAVELKDPVVTTQPEPRIPGRVVDLGTRIKRRTSFYEGVAVLEPVRTSANPDETKKEH